MSRNEALAIGAMFLLGSMLTAGLLYAGINRLVYGSWLPK